MPCAALLALMVVQRMLGGSVQLDSDDAAIDPSRIGSSSTPRQNAERDAEVAIGPMQRVVGWTHELARSPREVNYFSRHLEMRDASYVLVG